MNGRVYRQGPLAAWIRRSLESLLAPYVSGKTLKTKTFRKQKRP
jgi:hypothetical protein